MNWFKQAKNAIIVLIVVVFCTSGISAVSKINKQVDSLNKHFVSGDSAQFANQSMYNDLLALAERANQITLALSHNGITNATTKEVNDLVNLITTTSTFKVSALYQYYTKLMSDLNLLNSENKAIFEASPVKGYYAEALSCSHTIENDEYNGLVKSFYDQFDSGFEKFFLGFAKKAEYFR